MAGKSKGPNKAALKRSSPVMRSSPVKRTSDKKGGQLSKRNAATKQTIVREHVSDDDSIDDCKENSDEEETEENEGNDTVNIDEADDKEVEEEEKEHNKVGGDHSERQDSETGEQSDVGGKTEELNEESTKKPAKVVYQLRPGVVKLLKEALKAKHFAEVKFAEHLDWEVRAKDIAVKDLKLREHKITSYLPCLVKKIKTETAILRCSIIRSIKTRFEGKKALQ